MKSRVFAMAAFAGLFVSLRPLPSSAAEVRKFSISEETVMVDFFESTPVRCKGGEFLPIETSLFIGAFRRVNRAEGVTSEAFATYTVYNRCTNEVVEALPLIVNPQYTQSGTDSATLNMDVELRADLTGELLGVMKVALVFTGVGSEVRSTTRWTIRSGDYLLKYSARGVTRDAAVSGTVTIDGLDFMDNISMSQLQDNRSGELVIEK